MRVVELADGTSVPALGQGTWMMGETSARMNDELAALRLGLDLGMNLIDTAEIYGDGASEELVGEAIAGRRDEVFLVSKVAPSHASRRGTIAACEASLERLGTDRLDLYLLHWRGRFPLGETVAAMEDLIDAGKILRWGVSNFDVSDMDELMEVEGGDRCAVNQILLNLDHRGTEFDLLPWLEERIVATMAYSPIGQGGSLLRRPELLEVADRHDKTPAQIALAFTLRRPGTIAIPKASSLEHVRENAEAIDIRLDAEDWALLDEAFPPPERKMPLAII
ncbi:oxidoreductase [Aureimonas ureilytica]|uniref:Oxidoreductase n=1 Tax=Aureimonas ureilytica TaxID=401562 RepID=A0A175RYZ0_9HYPH|nr:aldo/keto reductase [Aureimonas ureilytica]KTR08052.1 oxidoreductase [Aureimonas ureilytica]